MTESIIYADGLTTLPKPVRKALGLKAGDKIRYLVYAKKVHILPVRPIDRLFGILKNNSPAVTSAEMDNTAADAACNG